VCRQTAALKKTEYTLGAVKGELERGLVAREAAKTRIAGADCCPCALLSVEAAAATVETERWRGRSACKGGVPAPAGLPLLPQKWACTGSVCRSHFLPRV
jgi:hypothetical protein